MTTLRIDGVWGSWVELHAFSYLFQCLIVVYAASTLQPIQVFETHEVHDTVVHIEFTGNHFRVLQQGDSGQSYGMDCTHVRLCELVFSLFTVDHVRDNVLRRFFRDSIVCDAWLSYVGLTHENLELRNRRCQKRVTDDSKKRKRDKDKSTSTMTDKTCKKSSEGCFMTPGVA